MSEADEHLIQLILAGDHDGWSQFVARYQKRLIAFATRQVDQPATAEDLVQETFIGFLKAISDPRDDGDLESLLFRILRRRIVDHYRRRGRNKEIPACRFGSTGEEDASDDPLRQAASADMHASWYARRNEARGTSRQALGSAIQQLTAQLQNGEKFRDLQIAEGLFYAGCRNQELARALGASENEIGVVKHRLVKRLKQLISQTGEAPAAEDFGSESTGGLLTTVWEEQRPSCPKRTTLGKYTLDLLPTDWQEYVRFHVEVLGCTFCGANLAELMAAEESADFEARNRRLFTSTVGFLRPQH